MIETETLKSIATQLMTSTSVSVDGKSIGVRHPSLPAPLATNN
jgi:hypothetical protein